MIDEKIEILNSDYALQIWEEFLFQYDHGVQIPKIRKILMKTHKKEIRGEFNFLFWIPLAYAEWKCGDLEEEVRDKLKEMVSKMISFGYRFVKNGENKSAKPQIEQLSEFIADSAFPNPQPLKRRIPEKIDPMFKAGDCVVVKFRNGFYGGFYVVNAVKGSKRYRDLGRNVFLPLDINQINKPTFKDFKKSKVIDLSVIMGWPQRYKVAHFLTKDLLVERLPQQEFQVVGNIPSRALFKTSGMVYWNIYYDLLESYFSNPLLMEKNKYSLIHRRSSLHNEPTPLENLKIILFLSILVVILLYLGSITGNGK